MFWKVARSWYLAALAAKYGSRVCDRPPRTEASTASWNVTASAHMAGEYRANGLPGALVVSVAP